MKLFAGFFVGVGRQKFLLMVSSKPLESSFDRGKAYSNLLAKMMKFTRIHYTYRDASNWKFHGSIVVQGHIRRSDIAPYLFEGEWFIPEKVGLHHLLTQPWSEDDHLLHELDECESVQQRYSDKNAISARDLLSRFAQAASAGWFSTGHATNQ